MRISTILAPAALLFLASCSDRADINGTWTSTPMQVGDDIAVADQATSVLSIDFDAPKGAKSGMVTMSAVIDGTQPAAAGSLQGFDSPYEISVAATATINGRWSYEDKDYDDILIFLDNATLQINVDPNGVTYSQNVLTGAQQPMVDSLTTVTIERWRSSLRNAVGKQFFNLNKLDDVKVVNGIMTCEVGHRDLTFHRTSAE